MRPLLGRLAHDCPSSGVTGNPIRAYTDPGGSDPLAESIGVGSNPLAHLIRPRINFTSGFDPSRAFYIIHNFADSTIRRSTATSTAGSVQQEWMHV